MEKATHSRSYETAIEILLLRWCVILTMWATKWMENEESMWFDYGHNFTLFAGSSLFSNVWASCAFCAFFGLFCAYRGTCRCVNTHYSSLTNFIQARVSICWQRKCWLSIDEKRWRNEWMDETAKWKRRLEITLASFNGINRMHISYCVDSYILKCEWRANEKRLLRR